MSFADKFAALYKKLLPSPLSIALILTVLTFLLALIFTLPENKKVGTYSIELLGSWEEGLWKEGAGGLYFAFQMMFMLIMGYIIALSAPINQLIKNLIRPCTNTAKAAFVVTAATILISLFNWGLGLIFGAILARKVGEKFKAENKKLNYPLIGAAAYSGLMVWHGGLSGSAPIKAAKEGNIHELVKDLNVDISMIPSKVEMGETVFSSMNITVSILLIILLPSLLYFIAKRSKAEYNDLPTEKAAEDTPKKGLKGAEKIDHSNYFGISIGLIIIFYAFHKAVIQPNEISLSFLTPNFINFLLLGLAFMVHKNVVALLKAAGEAISGATGILLQFPLYFGILGLMVGSGLLGEISNWFVAISDEGTFPILTFFSAGLVNVFIPSGGGQWAVQGPIIISAAQDLGVSYPKAIMALAYGDQLTNMIQPFWAIPLLGITGLKAKDILPYTLVLFFAGGLIFLLGLIVF
jgi:short-chain fatty acids transporter